MIVRLTVAVLVLALLAGGYFFWFRDSSLVAVDTVRVEGVDRDSGRAAEISRALVMAGHDMTTLNVDEDRLWEAVADFPEVRDLSVNASFPSTLEVTVALRRPVARIGEDDDAFGIAGDGTVLPSGSGAGADVPVMALSEPPDRGTLRGPALRQARVMAAAPAEMLAASESTAHSDEAGTVVRLHGGIELRFGDESRAEEKWQAAIAVLSDPSLQYLGYIDLSSPARPAVGGDSYEVPSVP